MQFSVQGLARAWMFSAALLVPLAISSPIDVESREGVARNPLAAEILRRSASTETIEVRVEEISPLSKRDISSSPVARRKIVYEPGQDYLAEGDIPPANQWYISYHYQKVVEKNQMAIKRDSQDGVFNDATWGDYRWQWADWHIRLSQEPTFRWIDGSWNSSCLIRFADWFQSNLTYIDDDGTDGHRCQFANNGQNKSSDHFTYKLYLAYA